MSRVVDGIYYVDDSTSADEQRLLDAATKAGTPEDYKLDWHAGHRTAYAEDEEALALHDRGLRTALSDMEWSPTSGGSVAALITDEMAHVAGLDDAALAAWEFEQEKILARAVGAENVEAAKAAAKNLAGRIKDKAYAGELEALGAFKSATWISQAWLQSLRAGLRGQ